MKILPRTHLSSKIVALTILMQNLATVYGNFAQLLSDQSRWAGLTDEQLEMIAGFHVVYSWPNATIPRHLLDLTRQGKVGGVIIFGENVSDDLPAQLSDLQAAYKESAAYVGYPLLVVTDQEGGEVVRLPGGPAQSAKEIGSSPHPASAASSAGAVAATACADYNVNGNLAPVLDVYRHPDDFDDEYQRSFSMNPQIVRECGAAFITAQQAAGVVATSKHFPGLGAATQEQNTDERPVTLDVSLEHLRTIDEVPFRGAIAAGVKMIMPSWAVYPALDPDRPSGLSTKWIRGELRGRLGFEGVTISDAINAGALEAFGDEANRAVLAVQAGMDIPLAAVGEVSQGLEIVHGLATAIRNGSISSRDFFRSTQRVLAVRKSLA